MFDPTKTKVYGLPDSGVFLDREHTIRRDHWYKKLIESFMKISNVEINPVPQSCPI